MRRGCVLLGLGVGASRRGEGRVRRVGEVYFFARSFAHSTLVRIQYGRATGAHTRRPLGPSKLAYQLARGPGSTQTQRLSPAAFFLFACAAFNTASCRVEAATLVTLLLSARARMHGFNRFSCCIEVKM